MVKETHCINSRPVERRVMRRSTTDLTTALAGGYIGEVPIEPKQVANAVHLALTGRRLWRGIVFYYGDNDEELDELFGYTTHNACEITGCEAVRLIDGLELNFERKTYGKRNISSQSKCALCKHRTVETRMGFMVSFRRRRS